MGFFSILLISIGLAMDSFAVSIAGGVALSEFKMRGALRVALFMGVAQALFFIVGYYLAFSVRNLICACDHWIAFLLLSVIGIKMILEHKKEDEERFVDIRRKRVLGTLAVATSIDALVVGLGFAVIKSDMIVVASVIGLVSFIFSGMGVFLGYRFSRIKSFPTYIVGGVLLIAIGLRVLIEHLVNHI